MSPRLGSALRFIKYSCAYPKTVEQCSDGSLRSTWNQKDFWESKQPTPMLVVNIGAPLQAGALQRIPHYENPIQSTTARLKIGSGWGDIVEDMKK